MLWRPRAPNRLREAKSAAQFLKHLFLKDRSALHKQFGIYVSVILHSGTNHGLQDLVDFCAAQPFRIVVKTHTEYNEKSLGTIFLGVLETICNYRLASNPSRC